VAGLVAIAVAMPVVGTAAAEIYRDEFYRLYTSRLDAWVAHADVKTIQADVVENCGKLVMSQARPFERLQLMTADAVDLDYHGPGTLSGPFPSYRAAADCSPRSHNPPGQRMFTIR
jgi:hypothetical protein